MLRWRLPVVVGGGAAVGGDSARVVIVLRCIPRSTTSNEACRRSEFSPSKICPRQLLSATCCLLLAVLLGCLARKLLLSFTEENGYELSSVGGVHPFSSGNVCDSDGHPRIE